MRKLRGRLLPRPAFSCRCPQCHLCPEVRAFPEVTDFLTGTAPEAAAGRAAMRAILWVTMEQLINFALPELIRHDALSFPHNNTMTKPTMAIMRVATMTSITNASKFL